jgi:hypothetical protein
MKLYHGTTEEVVRKVMKEGLRPRIATGKSNWDHTAASHPSMVYLTSVYAPYYGMCAIRDTKLLPTVGVIRPPKTGTRFGIVEIDTDLLEDRWFRPDEDFIEQVARTDSRLQKLIRGKTLNERTAWVRNNIDVFSHAWKLSVNNMGTCAYKGTILPSAITKVVTVGLSRPEMEHEAMEPLICIDNFRFCHPKYEMITKWFMGEKVSVEDYFKVCHINPFLTPEQVAKATKIWTEVLADQRGIEIVYERETSIAA